MPPPAVILARGAEAGRLKMSDTRPPEDLQSALQAAGYQHLTRAEWAKFRSNGRRRLRDLLATRRPTKALSIVVKMRPQLQEPQAEEWEEPPGAEEPPVGEEPWEQEQEHWEDPPAAEEPWEPGAEEPPGAEEHWEEPPAAEEPSGSAWKEHCRDEEEAYDAAEEWEENCREEEEAYDAADEMFDASQADPLEASYATRDKGVGSGKDSGLPSAMDPPPEIPITPPGLRLPISSVLSQLTSMVSAIWNEANPRQASRKRRRKER